jgi:opacity protein-like surface antigen
MRKVILFVIMVIGHICAMAQENVDVQPFEGGIILGVNYGLDSYYGGYPMLGLKLGFDVRYNIPKTKFDVGIYYYTNFLRHYLCKEVAVDGKTFSSSTDSAVNTIGAYSHYNFRQGQKVNPFVGLGIGYSDCDFESKSRGSHASIMPGVGIELRSRWRLCADFEIVRRGFNNFAFTVGYVFGGRPKKAK